jgi:uncharacterized protein (DUF2062 family)
LKITRFLKLIYLKLFRINDNPHRIALGFGLGVFSGIFPGTGPLAAFFLAIIFRANRAAALIGSILTNTWISLLSFILAVKAGAWLFGVNWQAIKTTWGSLRANFSWGQLFEASFIKTLLPVAAGYIIIAALSAVLAYAVSLLTVSGVRRYARRNKKSMA